MLIPKYLILSDRSFLPGVARMRWLIVAFITDERLADHNAIHATLPSRLPFWIMAGYNDTSCVIPHNDWFLVFAHPQVASSREVGDDANRRTCLCRKQPHHYVPKKLTQHAREPWIRKMRKGTNFTIRPTQTFNFFFGGEHIERTRRRMFDEERANYFSHIICKLISRRWRRSSDSLKDCKMNDSAWFFQRQGLAFGSSATVRGDEIGRFFTFRLNGRF